MGSFVYVLVALALTVYGQLIIKSRAMLHAEIGKTSHRTFLIDMFGDPWVLSALAAAVIATAAWMLAVRKEDLSLLYPFMALTFVFVPTLAALLLGETLTAAQLLGMALIVGGVSLTAMAK